MALDRSRRSGALTASSRSKSASITHTHSAAWRSGAVRAGRRPLASVQFGQSLGRSELQFRHSLWRGSITRGGHHPFAGIAVRIAHLMGRRFRPKDKPLSRIPPAPLIALVSFHLSIAFSGPLPHFRSFLECLGTYLRSSAFSLCGCIGRAAAIDARGRARRVNSPCIGLILRCLATRCANNPKKICCRQPSSVSVSSITIHLSNGHAATIKNENPGAWRRAEFDSRIVSFGICISRMASLQCGQPFHAQRRRAGAPKA